MRAWGLRFLPIAPLRDTRPAPETRPTTPLVSASNFVTGNRYLQSGNVIDGSLILIWIRVPIPIAAPPYPLYLSGTCRVPVLSHYAINASARSRLALAFARDSHTHTARLSHTHTHGDAGSDALEK